MMSWKTLLKPDLILNGSILQLSPQMVRDRGLRGLVLDVDETLVSFRRSDVSPELQAWLEDMRQHLDAFWLVSNNIDGARIGGIAKSLDLPYIHFARKPTRRKLASALKAMELPAAEVGMVGDRLLTDVLGGNRLGMYTILVEPMRDPGERPRVSYIRAIETWISRVYGHR